MPACRGKVRRAEGGVPLPKGERGLRLAFPRAAGAVVLSAWRRRSCPSRVAFRTGCDKAWCA